jgi:hypothetical protein
MSVTTEFTISQASLDAMVANPAAAVSGLTNGIADGLGVESSEVEIKRTVPDLLGGRRLADERRLEATLMVDFDVAIVDPAIGAKVDSLVAGDTSVVQSVTSAVQTGLAAESIQVTILSVAASEVVATAAPATAAPATAAPKPALGVDDPESTAPQTQVLLALAAIGLLC